MPLDTVQMARDTLKMKSGECDDLVGFFATLFEGAGINTALLDYPGHIALMFNTGISDPLELGIPEDKLVKYKDTYWVPVEATMVGKSFADSTRQAMSTYRNAGKDVKIIDTHEAWTEFEPVTLADTKWESPVPEKDPTLNRYREDAENLIKARYDFLKSHFDKLLSENKDNPEAMAGLGIVEAQHGHSGRAKELFAKILETDPSNPSALNNLGNMAYQEKNFAKADEFYQKASKADPFDPGVWLNRTRAAVKLGDKKTAKEFADKVIELDSKLRDTAESILNN